MLQNKKRIGAGLFALLLAMLNLLNVQAQSTELTEGLGLLIIMPKSYFASELNVMLLSLVAFEM